MKVLLIDNYDSFTYNLFHYISKIKKNVEVIRNDKIDGKTVLGKKSILDWSKDLLEVSKKGLENRNELNSKKQNEVKFLDHIKIL